MKPPFSFLFAPLCLFLPGAGFAQAPVTPAAPPNPYRLLFERGAYLQAIAAQEARVQSAPKGEERARALQTLAGYYTFLGDATMAQNLMGQSDREQGVPARGTSREQFTYEMGLSPRPAVDEIVRAAKNKQIVILNENHSASQNRAFATLLVRALKKEGFTYFAAETFAPPAVLADTQKRGYPDRKTGYYTLDPVFGDLVRQAQNSGYKLVAYETEDEKRPPDFVDATNARETAQAHNLIERIFKNDPKARVFIYVGFSHASEVEQKEPDGRAIAWMATRLKRETGIDPLTIEQSQLFEPSDAKEDAANANPVAQFRMTQPTVLRRANGTYWRTGTGAGTMDMQVFHPFVREKQGRPDWLKMNGYRKPFSMDAALVPKTGRVLIQAFASNETSDAALPVDQILLTANKPVPVLMLPKGKYRLVVQDEGGVSRPVGRVTQK